MMRTFEQGYFNRAKQAAGLFSYVPFIRLVGLNGSLILGTASEESDIDLLIISVPNRIFTTRLLTNMASLLTGSRRLGKLTAGKLCLNRYQTTASLKVLPENRYHARYFSRLVPLLDIAQTYLAYQRANRSIARFGYRVTPASRLGSIQPIVSQRISAIVFERLLSGIFGDWLEIITRRLQERRIVQSHKFHQAPVGRIRLSEKEICLHPLKD